MEEEEVEEEKEEEEEQEEEEEEEEDLSEAPATPFPGQRLQRGEAQENGQWTMTFCWVSQESGGWWARVDRGPNPP